MVENIIEIIIKRLEKLLNNDRTVIIKKYSTITLLKQARGIVDSAITLILIVAITGHIRQKIKAKNEMAAMLIQINKLKSEGRLGKNEVQYNFLNVVKRTKTKLIKIFYKLTNNQYFVLVLVFIIILQLIIYQKEKNKKNLKEIKIKLE